MHSTDLFGEGGENRINCERERGVAVIEAIESSVGKDFARAPGGAAGRFYACSLVQRRGVWNGFSGMNFNRWNLVERKKCGCCVRLVNGAV